MGGSQLAITNSCPPFWLSSACVAQERHPGRGHSVAAPSPPTRASQDANLAPPEELPLPPELVGLHQALPRGLSVRPFLCRAIAGERWHFRGSELLSQDPTAMPMAAPQPQGPRNSTSVLTHGASLAEGGARAPLSCSRRSSRLPSCVAVGWFFFRWEVKKSYSESPFCPSTASTADMGYPTEL